VHDEPTLLLTKGDIAALAGVRRPVVTVWTSRYRDTDRPFPRPVRIDARQEKFAATEVVEWIRDRGLGNNDTLAEDVAVHAALDHPTGPDRQVVFAGLTALLCMKAQLDEPLADLDADELLDEADELDPDDDHLYREIEALGAHLATYARHADRMADAAYTPERAFEAALAQRFRIPLPELAASALTPVALDLCVRVATALAPDDRAVFVDPSDDGSDLLVALRGALSEDVEPFAITGRGDTPSARLARRRLAIHRWRRQPAPVDGFGAEFSVDRPALFLTQFPSPSAPDASAVDVLTRIDNITVQMGADHHVVVVAPAAVLVDPLRDREALSIRSGIVRTGRLRAAVRLPEGLLVTKPGTAMALWVLGAPDGSAVSAEGWMVLADIAAHELDDDTIDGVVSDVVAAVDTVESVRAHAFRFGRVENLGRLLAEDRRGLLVTRRALAPIRGADAASRVMTLTDRVNAGAREVDGDLSLSVTYHRAGISELPTAGELVDARKLAVISGNRIDDTDLVADGTIRVIGPDELLGHRRLGQRTVDPLAYTTRYRSARHTEPGDIVFCTSPRTGVLVDTEGASLVLAPARVLRVRHPNVDGLVPELIARHLRMQAPGTKPAGAVRGASRWREWTIPVIAPRRVDDVTATLAELDARRRAVRGLLDDLDLLTDTIIDGTIRGVLSVAAEHGTVPEEG